MKAGFSLVEMVCAMAITVSVVAATFALMDPSHGIFAAVPEAIDVQQRLRVSSDAITRDLIMAGAGQGKYFASILPWRRGSLRPDPAGAFFNDRISVLWVGADSARTSVRVMTGDDPIVPVNPVAGCPSTNPVCRFVPDMSVIVFDETGASDTFRVARVETDPPALVFAGPRLSKGYAPGAVVAQVDAATYWLRVDPSARTSELMKYDGRETDLPIADDVSGLRFEYYGDPSPPVLRRLLSDVSGPWTSYGPKPPEPAIDDVATPSYAAGESCTFTTFAGVTIPRPEMALSGPPASLVRLDEAALTDGPWCPDPAARNRFDADLLRVRRIRVTLKVRERAIAFDVTPRNWSLPQ